MRDFCFGRVKQGFRLARTNGAKSTEICRFAAGSGLIAHPKHITTHYREGETYELYLSEKDPCFCLLERRVLWKEALWFLFGVLVAVSAFLCFDHIAPLY